MSDLYDNGVHSNLVEQIETALQTNNFTLALTKLRQAEIHPYHHFCGNAVAAHTLRMKVLYGRAYIGLHHYRKAKEELLPLLFANQLADNLELSQLAYDLLSRRHSKQWLKTAYLKAFKKYKVKKEIESGVNFTTIYIRYAGVKVFLPSFISFTHQTEESIVNFVQHTGQDSHFYHILSQ